MSKPDLSIFRAVPKEQTCVIGKLPLTPERLILFSEVLEADKDEFPTTRIQEVLKEQWGIEVSITTLRSHRHKKCVCFKAPKQESK